MQVHSLLALSACLSSVSALPWMSSLFAQTINYDPKSNQQDPATGSQQNNVGSPNRAVIPDWQTCQPNVDSCSTPGYICCVNAPDLWNNKATCRPPSDCKSMNNNPPISDVGGPCNQAIQNAAVCKPGLVCNPPAVAMPGAAGTCALPNNNGGGNKIDNWQTCQQGRDSCASNGFVCCVAQADLWNNKATCRPQNDCSNGGWNNGGNNGNNGNNGGNQVGNKIDNWQTCQQGRDSCASNGFVCCVAQADLGSGKATCRPQNDCSNGSWNNGGNNNGNNGNNGGSNNSGNKVADWQTCQFGRDSCLNNNYVCCVAQADLGIGKATCRPKDQCGNTNGGNSNNGNNNGGSGKLVPMWENCGLTDTCANGFVCCAAKADLVGGKTTCRPSNDCGNTSWLAQCTKDDWMCGTDRKTLYQCTPSKMNMWVWAPKKECDSGFFCYDDGQYVGCRNW